MGGPQLILLDEPSQGLAPLIVKAISAVMEDLRTRGITILLVEQNVEMATRVATYFHIMDQGRIVWSGDKEEFKGSTKVREKYLGV
jgi:branched-chain amino acid transport system ATP-binding protein